MLVLDEADLMLSMPGYEEDLRAIAPLVRTLHPATCPSAAHIAGSERYVHGVAAPIHLPCLSSSWTTPGNVRQVRMCSRE